MDLLELFWDWNQQQRLNAHDSRLSSHDLRDARQDEEIRELRRELHLLRSTCHGLAKLLVDKGVLAEAELAQRVADVRRSVPEAMGKVRCDGCDRLIVPMRGRCLYCGTASARPSAS